MAVVKLRGIGCTGTAVRPGKKDVLPVLQSRGVSPEDLKRCVYVIRLNGLFAIEYPHGISPTVYIGEGNFEQRITQHKNWLMDLADLQGEYEFLIGYCFPPR